MADDNPRTTPGLPVALTIAGSDSGGGAGVQADLKTFTAMGVFGTSAITAITAQNTQGVRHSQILDSELVAAQIDAVASDIGVHATKTGMLGNAGVVKAVAKAIERNNLLPLVVDPVMVSKNGDALLDDDAIKALTKELLPQAAVVTPNRAEAAKLLGTGDMIDSIETAGGAAEEICEQFGARACIIKGFKRENDEEGEAIDIYYDGNEVREVAAAWRPTESTHGAGCVFAAALAAELAKGASLDDAVVEAKETVSEAIRQCTDLGGGRSPVNPLSRIKVK